MTLSDRVRHARFMLLERMIIGSVPVLNRLRPRSNWQHTLADLRHLPPNSWGISVASFLDQRGFDDFLPNYEAHDAFHTLLDYDTNVIGELRLQAFMLGNRSASLAGRVLFILGSMIMPELWSQLRHDFMRGRQSERLAQWNVPALLAKPLEHLQTQIMPKVDVLHPNIC